jgi:hypothetical protein
VPPALSRVSPQPLPQLVQTSDDHGPGRRIISPDYVDVDIPRTSATALSQPSPVSASSEGYPSWLPRRPPPPAPDNTLHSLGITPLSRKPTLESL